MTHRVTTWTEAVLEIINFGVGAIAAAEEDYSVAAELFVTAGEDGQLLVDMDGGLRSQGGVFLII